MFEFFFHMGVAYWVLALIGIIGVLLADSRYPWFKRMLTWHQTTLEAVKWAILFFVIAGLAIFLTLVIARIFHG